MEEQRRTFNSLFLRFKFRDAVEMAHGMLLSILSS